MALTMLNIFVCFSPDRVVKLVEKYLHGNPGYRLMKINKLNICFDKTKSVCLKTAINLTIKIDCKKLHVHNQYTSINIEMKAFKRCLFGVYFDVCVYTRVWERN